MNALFDRLDDVLRTTRIAQLEKELEEARHAIKVLSMQNRQMRSEMDKGQQKSVTAWMDKYAKLEADFLAYRQKCNADGTAPKKRKKKKDGAMSLMKQWAILNSVNGKDEV